LCWQKYVKARIEPGKWSLYELPLGRLIAVQAPL
jgi:hypothetical protein